MNQVHPFTPSVRTSRKRIRSTAVVEIQVGGQLKRYRPVRYRLAKNDQPLNKQSALPSDLAH